MMLAQVDSPLAIENPHQCLLDMEDDEKIFVYLQKTTI